MAGILSVLSFCEVCSAVSRSISWARCFLVVTAEPRFLKKKLAHFVAFVAKVGVVTTEASQSEKLRKWNGIFNVLRMKGPVQQIVMNISSFVMYASR